MNNIKIALIGCGYFGTLHAEVYKSMQGAELTAVCDISHERADRLAAGNNCPAYTDVIKMISEVKPDMLDICAPDGLHLKYVLAAMEYSLHMFVEKPLADNIADYKTIIEQAGKGYTKKAAVGYICRFEPRNLAAFEAIRENAVGDIMYMTSRRVSPLKGGLHYAPQCRLTTHSGVHDFDLARWFAGVEFKKCTPKAQKGG